MNPLVSICMPCHNAGKYVRESIESVLNQTYKNIELIVVDDGSTDQSVEVLKKNKDRRVKVIKEKFGNASRARNRALKEARGKYIKFLDADDLISRNMIEMQLRKISGKQNSVAMSEWGRFYNDDINTFQSFPQNYWRDLNGIDWLVESVKEGQPMMQVGMFLMPKSLVKQSGPWNENLSLHDDFEYFCRLLAITKKIYFTKNTILYYRSGLKNSLSKQNTLKARISECTAVLEGTKTILKVRKDTEAKTACANICQIILFSMYPKYPELRRKIQKRIAQCGGAKIIIIGGKKFNLARKILGWKIAKILQCIIEDLAK